VHAAIAGWNWLDGAVLVGSFLGITLFGLSMARKIKCRGGYLLGDRQLPWY